MKTMREVAKLFSVTYMTVYRWIRDGKIKVVRVGGTIRITDEEIKRITGGDNIADKPKI